MGEGLESTRDRDGGKGWIGGEREDWYVMCWRSELEGAGMSW